ncbi:TPA: hypothetical protein ACYLN4_007277 [Burkholderia lata]
MNNVLQFPGKAGTGKQAQPQAEAAVEVDSEALRAAMTPLLNLMHEKGISGLVIDRNEATVAMNMSAREPVAGAGECVEKSLLLKSLIEVSGIAEGRTSPFWAGHQKAVQEIAARLGIPLPETEKNAVHLDREPAPTVQQRIHMLPHTPALSLNPVAAASADFIDQFLRNLCERGDDTPEIREELHDQLEALVPALVELRDGGHLSLNMGIVTSMATLPGFMQLAADERLSPLSRARCEAIRNRMVARSIRALFGDRLSRHQ